MVGRVWPRQGHRGRPLNSVVRRHRPTMVVRRYRPEDAPQLVALFRKSVSELASSDYSPDQLRAWAQDSVELPAWVGRLTNAVVVVCEIESQIAGFASVEPNGHLDLLYVHPQYARQGVATRLCAELEEWARRNGVARMFTEASISAKPFFEVRGFRTIRAQTAYLLGVTMENFAMEKDCDV